ncbi:hypothetical protein ACKKBG_A03490 [Auxenochlorella protothecoides x Auxenochlorella symbiontica]
MGAAACCTRAVQHGLGKPGATRVQVTFVKTASPQKYPPSPPGNHTQKYQLLRDISPTSIPPHCIEDMMLKTLGPVMGSDLGPALDFKSYILRQNLRTGSRVTVLFSTDGSITAVTTAPGASFNAVECHPELITQSPALCAGVFEVYLREKSVAPLARDAWIRSVMAPDRGQT